jgi:hypothetical protein
MRQEVNAIPLNRFLTIAIYVSIFINSIVFFKEPFEFYLGYLIYIVLLPVFMMRYGMKGALFYIFLILFASGLFNIFLNNNTADQFFKIFTGLALSYFFYYYVIIEYSFDIESLFKWYLKGAYIVCVIGLIQFVSFQLGFKPGYDYSWILNKWGIVTGGNFGIRINSVFGEPTYLGAVISSAFFVAVYDLTRREKFYFTPFQSLLIIAVYLLSFSGLAQVGIIITLIFLAVNFGLFRYIFIFIPIGILIFSFMYNNITEFRERYDSLITLFTTGKFVLGKTHGSSFILYNNFNVAIENFKSNFVFGSGVGSHPVAFEKYSVGKYIGVYGFNLNSQDANSMLLRLISETGLFGVLIFAFIIFKCYVRRNAGHPSYHWLVSNALLVMILLNLFRQGHYFLNGFPFFVILYYFNWQSWRSYLETGETLYEKTISEASPDNPVSPTV